MTVFHPPRIFSQLSLLAFLLSASLAIADDADELTTLLHDFLAGVSEAAVHDRFWADDLVYTSSSGTRTSKAEIMRGFDAAENGDTDEPEPEYSAEDIEVKVYGATAVVAFRLVASTPGEARSQYFNTGTFVKRANRWQVVAWQATVIPD